MYLFDKYIKKITCPLIILRISFPIAEIAFTANRSNDDMLKKIELKLKNKRLIEQNGTERENIRIT